MSTFLSSRNVLAVGPSSSAAIADFCLLVQNYLATLFLREPASMQTLSNHRRMLRHFRQSIHLKPVRDLSRTGLSIPPLLDCFLCNHYIVCTITVVHRSRKFRHTSDQQTLPWFSNFFFLFVSFLNIVSRINEPLFHRFWIKVGRLKAYDGQANSYAKDAEISRTQDKG